MPNEERVPILSDVDIVIARQKGRAMAAQIGFSGAEATLIATSISEVARNILEYAVRGEIILRPEQNGSVPGMAVIARDEGPGIPDIPLAMQDGYTTGRGLGLGLPGSRRLMDEFQIESSVGVGTTVTMRKWVR
ncbi:MAG: ATP-binding protein [Ignavibacteria bacterium 13_1_40CM_2_61_4]|nr:MAG: ATP-binding protein [Ignavibacteria bacterium 13_1_40CM_2_61_4]